MKTSKLKYVIAFLLLAMVTIITNNVSAATLTSGTLSSIKMSALSGIIDGDEGSGYANIVYHFNTKYSLPGTALGGAENVYTYSVLNNVTGIYSKVYTLGYGDSTTNKDGVELTGVGTGSALDNKIGLALAFGFSGNALTQSQLAEGTYTDGQSAASFATQLYIWIANAGLTGTVSEANILATVPADVQAQYGNIAYNVNQAMKDPSYSYGSVGAANSTPIEMNWNSANGRYEYTVTDTNGLDTMSLINLIVESNSGIQYSKNGNSITFYTYSQVGSASAPVCIPIYKSVNNGYWVPAYSENVSSGQDYVYLSGRQKANTVSYVSFYTNALRVEISKTLLADASNSRTGDATRVGAVYGIYKDAGCTELLQQVVIGADGKAMSDPLELGDYYVKEIAASEGCLIDASTYPARLSDAVIAANGQRVVSVSSSDQVIYGGFRMIVSYSDLTGDTTKQPSVGSEIKLYLNSNPSEFYIATVDATGYVDFAKIPYGKYTCVENKNNPSHPELDLMDPISIYINTTETFIYSKIVNTEVAQRLIKIEKRDAESGLLIPVAGTKFQVRDSDGKLIVQTVKYPVEMTIDTYETDVSGYLVMPDMLPYGTYKVYEITAPDGYYNDSAVTGNESAQFTVTSTTPENQEKEIVVSMVANKPQKVNYTINTKGTILTGTNANTSADYSIDAPAYGAGNVAGAKYKLTAKKDIKTGDNVVHMAAGATKILTADSNGTLTEKLYLGEYTLEQIFVPEGYVLDTEVYDIVLTYQGQKILEYPASKTFTNVIQSYEVNLTKEFQDLYFFKNSEDTAATSVGDEMYKDVVLGIYTAEQIKNVNGEVKIAADVRVDALKINNDGTGKVNVQLPVGKYYVKELETNDNYILSDEKHYFTVAPKNNADTSFVLDLEKIINVAKKVTKLDVTKVEVMLKPELGLGNILDALLGGIVDLDLDEVDILKLAGAKFSIEYLSEDTNYYKLQEKVDGVLVDVVRTSDANGNISIEGLPFGTYRMKEVEAPKYYDLIDGYIEFKLTVSEPEIESYIANERTLVNASFIVKDEDGNPIKNATVRLIDTELLTGKIVVTDEDGLAVFEDIRAGRYVRQVSDLAAHYVTPEDEEMYIVETVQEAIEVEARFVMGNILVYKTDVETGLPVPGCKFEVTNELDEVVASGESDENGYFLAENLRYGIYYVEEVEAIEGYEKSGDIYEVFVEVDGVTYEVDFTNVPTGDIAVALYAVVAMVSIVAIAVTIKKLKRN